MKTIEVKRQLVEEILDQLKRAQQDCYVESTEIIIDEVKAVLRQTAVISRFIYLITNETDRIVESAWSNFDEAKKQCKQWEKMKPQKKFMVVGLPINGC